MTPQSWLDLIALTIVFFLFFFWLLFLFLIYNLDMWQIDLQLVQKKEKQVRHSYYHFTLEILKSSHFVKTDV